MYQFFFYLSDVREQNLFSTENNFFYIKHENSRLPLGNKMVGALTSVNVLGATPQSIDLVFISEQILAFSTLVTSL
jgi:hypothetical protein